MAFWQSELGEITGNQDDAFAKEFAIIPDGEMAKAKINSFVYDDSYEKMYVIKWVLTEGTYEGREVSQKIRCFDDNANKRHRALNMLKLVYQTFNMKPETNEAPTDKELVKFVGKIAGIKIRQWGMQRDNGEFKEGNFVSEVHNPQGFVAKPGKHKDLQTNAKPAPQFAPPIGQPNQANDFVDDILPF